MSWYYAENGNQNGPVTDAEWQSLIGSGRITPDTLVWQEGMAQWLPYAQAPGSASTMSVDLTKSSSSPSTGNVTCAYCKNTFPSDEVISMNGQMVCSNCKPVAVQMMKEGVNAPGEFNYGSFGARFGAKIIDGILGYIVTIVLGIAAGLTKSETATILASVLSMSIQFAYIVYFNGKFGATLGKMACGLKIVRPDGAPLTYGRAVGRYFAEWVSGLTLGIGYLMAAFDKPERRALHDRIADTRVIKK